MGKDFEAWLQGKECRMQTCPEKCERKYRLSFGRRLLSDDNVNSVIGQESTEDIETEAEIRTGTKAQWGGIKKAIKKVIPKRVYYDDCSRKNDCLTKNAQCKAKLDALRAAVAALDKEIAAAKAVADSHSATAAQKSKYAALKKKDADAAKVLLDEAQSAVGAKAKDLADSRKHQSSIASFQSSEVAKDAKAKSYAARKHAEEAKELKEAQEEIAGIASDHHDKASIAAKAKADADAAHALANIKKDVMKLHQERRDATAKKIELALAQTDEEFGAIKESMKDFGAW